MRCFSESKMQHALNASLRKVCSRSNQEPKTILMSPLQFYKCLSDDTRLRCMLLIEHEQELCVCELTEALQEIQPKISRHLAQLRSCELLVDRRQGQWVFYRVNPALPIWAKNVLAETLASNSAFLKNNLQHLNRMRRRPDRTQACS